jgi:arylsulfatase A-like enzyme
VLNPASNRGRPHVLLIHSHDLGRFLNCYGVPTVHTPNLDRLAAEGVLFEKSFASAPQCSPSRASIFTGRYPHCNGMLGLAHFPFCWELHPDELHLGQILRQAGYRTAGIGVLHETHSGPQRCGFEEYLPQDRATEAADAAIDLLTRFSRDPGRPFYLQVGVFEPHRAQGTDPTRDLGFLGHDLAADTSAGVTIPGYLQDTPGTRTELGELQGAVRHLDRELGRILEALTRLEIKQNTLVLFTTDHGVALPRAKCTLYEPGMETALILRLPSRPGWSGGRRESALIPNIDYLPTILEAAGVPVPDRVQGRSFAPLLDGCDYRVRDVLFSELTYHDYYDPLRAVRTADHKLIVSFTAAPSYMDSSQSSRPRSDTVVPANHALSVHPPLELYDLRRDPWEQVNLAEADAYAGVLESLRGLLHAHMTETDDPLLRGAVTSPLHRRNTAWLSTGKRGPKDRC